VSRSRRPNKARRKTGRCGPTNSAKTRKTRKRKMFDIYLSKHAAMNPHAEKALKRLALSGAVGGIASQLAPRGHRMEMFSRAAPGTLGVMYGGDLGAHLGRKLDPDFGGHLGGGAGMQVGGALGSHLGGALYNRLRRKKKEEGKKDV